MTAQAADGIIEKSGVSGFDSVESDSKEHAAVGKAAINRPKTISGNTALPLAA